MRLLNLSKPDKLGVFMKLLKFVLMFLFISFLTGFSFSQTNNNLSNCFIDSEGNKYKTVKIGNQIWMAENFNCSLNLSGEKIKFYEYNNDSKNSEKFGRLYNHSVMINNMVPEGWKIPSKDDWMELIKFLGGEKIAGKKLKENGFNLKYTGMRDFTNVFQWINETAVFLSSTKKGRAVISFFVKKDGSEIKQGTFHPDDAFSVRLIKVDK